MDLSTPVGTSTVVGYIARRRCVGKHLTFAHIQLLEEDANVDSATTFSEAKSDEQRRVIQVIFRRNSPEWNSQLDDTFPSKKTKLPFGGKVSVELVCREDEHTTTEKANEPIYLVREWLLLENPRDVALAQAQELGTDGISCTKYYKSRTDAFLRFNDNTLKKKPKDGALKAKKSEHEEMDPSTSEFSHGDPRAKGLRAQIFADWLLRIYGQDFLKGGVLDIAGGKGKLSIELAVQGQIPATIVDPFVRKHGSNLERRDAKRIRKIQAPHPHLMAKCFDERFVQDEANQKLWSSVSLCVGLHPDECTEDILDLSLQHQKPVAIVPCCVFTGFFPLRLMPNGDPVRTYEQFLAYLLAKDPRLRRETLPFEGRNIVIYLPPVESD